MSSHYRPLLGHEAAQVITTMQTMPDKATVVVGMLHCFGPVLGTSALQCILIPEHSAVDAVHVV